MSFFSPRTALINTFPILDCLIAPGNFTGEVLTNGDCNSQNGLPGCGIIDPSRASYGPEFNNLGGGVFAMMWDVTGVKVCAHPCPSVSTSNYLLT
jgi:hypothetical protein